MVCSFGDSNDVQLFRELGLKEIKSINPNGKTTEHAKQFSNLSTKEARRKITEELKAQGLVNEIKTIFHRTPICERSRTPIEIISLEDYYLKQIDFKTKLLEYSNNIKFYPEMHRQILINWINSITIDWPISRRRFYGTKSPCGIVKNVDIQMSQNQEGITGHGKKNPLLINVRIVTMMGMNLKEKRGYLTHGCAPSVDRTVAKKGSGS